MHTPLRIQRRTADLSLGQFETLHPLIQKILISRGAVLQQHLQCDLKYLISPQQLKGLTQAMDLLVVALTQQQRILIIGDFDADGATSTSVAVLALRAMGAQHVDYLVPNRFEYGYGLTPEIVAVAAQRKPELMITVDNGISSVEGVQAAKALGIRVLITDHHLAGAQLPEADAIVNPNQPGCNFLSKNLAGVGVIFYVMSALRSRLREIHWFESNHLAEPNMAQFLDLVALGTVADVVPLDHNNRVLVQQGLQRIRVGQCRVGIIALLEIANRPLERLVAGDLGFAVGPRLNAAGRLEDMSIGIECLLCDDPQKARQLAAQLDRLNQERKTIEFSMQQEALHYLDHLKMNPKDLPYGLCLFDRRWHQGVIGILASRIKDKFHRPIIAFAEDKNQQLKGSARSIPGLHIRDVLDEIAAKNPGLILKFGGHAMAAGLSLFQEKFHDFSTAFNQVVRQYLSEDQLQAIWLTDGCLTEAELNLSLAETLVNLLPWGQNFPEPLFEGCFELLEQKIVGQRHLKMVLSLPESNRVLDGIAFNIDTKIWPNAADNVRLIYKLGVNEYRGVKSLQLIVEAMEVVL